MGVDRRRYDRLVELGLPVVAYNGGEAPYDKERFVNARAEAYWNFRELFENGEIDIDELDDVLAAQLGSLKWAIDPRGRIKIESKDEMRSAGCRRQQGRHCGSSLLSSGGHGVDVEGHAGEGITGDLMTKAW